MVEKGEIEQGVINMLKVNMGIKSGEKLLIATDVPTNEEWVKKESEKLQEMIEGALLAKMVSEIASEKFPDCEVQFYAYPCVGRHGVEPGKEVGKELEEADVAVAMTSCSLSHTKAREDATKTGTRIASMSKSPETFYPGGPMAANYIKIREEGKKIAKLVNQAKEVTLTSPAGTNLKFSLEGRKGLIDDGIFIEKSAFGNLPSGEVYTAPLEGTAHGDLVVQRGWYADLIEDMTFVFKDGKVTEVIGGSRIGDNFREMLACEKDEEPYRSRRNCAELGIGLNPNAKRIEDTLEAEKIRETVHIAIGDNSHMGGKVSADLHQDFVIPKPTLKFDGKMLIESGKIRI